MSISVACGSCGTKLNAPDAAAGKRVKCPKCQAPMLVPGGDAEPEPLPPVDAPVPSRRRDEPEEDDRPQARSRRDRDDEEADDRPRRRRRRSDDDDDRPKKKNSLAWLWILLGVGLPVLGCGGFCLLASLGGWLAGTGTAAPGKDLKEGERSPVKLEGPRAQGNAPAGFVEVIDDDVKFRCVLQLDARQNHSFKSNNEKNIDIYGYRWSTWQSVGTANPQTVNAYQLTSGTHPTTSKEVQAVLRKRLVVSAIDELQSETTIPGGFQFRYRQKDADSGAKLIRVLVKGDRLVAVTIEDGFEEPDPAMVKTVFDSLQWR